ncbi:MAG: histidine triad nucleotide-binding protein [Epsilonproteobacteria bacterium]|nr:histidine triad nucleotide-binding protein [Campylobacterota bacterium]
MCIFCDIIAGKIPSTKVNENDDFLAFEDINKIAPIHVLIIPKEHIPSFNEMPAQKMAQMSEFIKETAQKLGVFEDGYRLITNINDNGGQEVKHLHFHLVGGAKLKWPKLV